ncbi:hypothetical protein [Reichenbachiella versicolor]|uniref:hypothetical protein n=1 Tax=Reichenbachiella versicolor TaxID=1821036 RepID=UPI000D6E0CBB|nr:hypothetical protein [Reichenbachiella versicolor]
MQQSVIHWSIGYNFRGRKYKNFEMSLNDAHPAEVDRQQLMKIVEQNSLKSTLFSVGENTGGDP